MTTQMIAVVTGASRGLGKATAQALADQGYLVIAGVRDLKQPAYKGVEPQVLDVSSQSSIESFVANLIQKYGRCDVLVNNAGVFNPGDVDANGDPMQLSRACLQAVLDTNLLGAYFLTQKILPLMKKNNYGRVVNVSSGMGALNSMREDFPAYRISKTALNAVTGVFAAHCGVFSNIKVNSVCPGWVRTDMGGSQADRSIEEGIDSIVWAATLSDNGPSGKFFRDRKEIAW